MKLEVGMYVRTKYKGILPFLSEDKEHYYFGKSIKEIEFCCLKEELSRFIFDNVPSYNIIDLIEEGDYVNGLKITTIKKGEKLYVEDKYGYLIELFRNEEIKSVVTREQFENMKYEV